MTGALDATILLAAVVLAICFFMAVALVLITIRENKKLSTLLEQTISLAEKYQAERDAALSKHAALLGREAQKALKVK